MPAKKRDDQYVPDESDSTKSRRLAEDYDSTKNGMDYGKYQGTHCHNFMSCNFAPTAAGRLHAACVHPLLAGHQADILRKSRQGKRVCVMGMSTDRVGDRTRECEKDYPLPRCVRDRCCTATVQASSLISSQEPFKHMAWLIITAASHLQPMWNNVFVTV